MESLIKDIIEQYGYFGIFFLIALENVFPPIPSELILTFGGYMTYGTNLSVTGVVISSTIGSIMGAICLYCLGLLLNVKRLEKIIERYGRILRLTKEDINRADSWFDQYGSWTVLFCRLIPLIRSLISIPAGMAKMNFWLFLIFSTIGTLVWNTLLVNLGARLGANWENVVYFMNRFSNVMYLIIIILFIALIGWYIKERKVK
ncbi:DedA family protein [Bacillus salipaludis]|uniref:DedA family protein n=1 Tax=Bacillus salipaludis TaxID=2547811 RepID=UPI002E1D76EF|nr:DedA family protein [Bacillus salipaludis]